MNTDGYERVTLMIIDDDEDDRDFFRMACEGLDFKTSIISSHGTDDALQQLRSNSRTPDFIFLDLNMPGKDGRACLKALKEDFDTSSIPVVIFSTSSEHSDIIETKAMGALAFMTKAPDIDELTVNLGKFLASQLKTS